jgi:hypothetical protein
MTPRRDPLQAPSLRPGGGGVSSGGGGSVGSGSGGGGGGGATPLRPTPSKAPALRPRAPAVRGKLVPQATVQARKASEERAQREVRAPRTLVFLEPISAATPHQSHQPQP